jgi:hypothetical protein
VRENYSDTPIPIPSAALPGLDWQYIDAQHVQLTLNGAPVSFGAPGTHSPTALYEFTYVAQNPKVVGIGFASARDFATFLRDAKTDEQRLDRATSCDSESTVMSNAVQGLVTEVLENSVVDCELAGCIRYVDAAFMQANDNALQFAQLSGTCMSYECI